MKVTIYTDADTLPALNGDNFFHSKELMALCLQTPRHKPYMAVATDDEGRVCGQLLAIERYRHAWLPPFLHRHVRIMGEGVYADEPSNMLFSMMIHALTRRLQGHVLYMEVSNLSQKMFGYAPLRAEGYFPVRWMKVHNSLHSRPPEERINERQLQRIESAMQRGIETHEVKNDEEFCSFSRLLRRHNWLKPRRFMPDDSLFRSMMETGRCKIYITTYKGITVGCSVVVYSEGDAYLLYSASRRKSFATLHPNAVTFWNTIRYCHQEGCQHIRFMDVELPYQRNPYREFILSFGGKEVSTYRWFHTRLKLINKLASWLWRE